MATDRIAFLEDFLTRKPTDDFAQYALAMEYAKAGRTDDALGSYQSLLTRNPDHAAGHFQCGLLLQRLGRIDEARARLREGISAATRTGDAHARREMQAALDDLDLEG